MNEEFKYDPSYEKAPLYSEKEKEKQGYQFFDPKEIDSNPVYKRKLIHLDTSPIDPKAEIAKISSYNILASKFLFRFMYKVDKCYADFNYRSQNVLKELEYYDSDILCLQEVDNYEEFYRENFAKLGYGTIFKMKAKRGRYWLFPGVGAVLGYKTDKYDLIDQKTLIYDDMDKDLKNTGIEGIFALLKSKKTGNMMLVADTHTHWNSEDDFVQYGQVALLMTQINEFLTEKQLQKIPIVVCGDFNVKSWSNVIRYMKQEPPAIENPKSSWLCCKNSKEKVLGFWEKYQNKYKFKSTYEDPKNPGKYFAEYTHYHNFHKGVLDFIFCTENMKVKAIRSIPSREELGDHTPNQYFPSDHLRIESILEFKT